MASYDAWYNRDIDDTETLLHSLELDMMDLSVGGSSSSRGASALTPYHPQKPKPLTIDPKSVLGKGAYGQVYKGMLHTEPRKRAVAIKQMSYNPQSTNGIPLAALREIAATSHLDGCPYIISLLDNRLIKTDHPNTNKLVLVYELMTCDLTKFLKDFRNEHGRNQQLPMDLIQKWSRQLMLGMDYMHTRRITHRDMKPDNILIDRHTMDLKITDLGLAHLHGFEGSRTPEVVTLWYRSPEIVLRLPYGSSCDIWSLGLIMYEMVKLRPLVVGEGEIELFRNIVKLTGKPSDVYLCNLGVSSWECFVKKDDLPLVNHIQDRLFGEDPTLIDLFERLLKFESEERLTAYEALQHPFFQPDYLAGLQRPVSPALSEISMETESESSLLDEDYFLYPDSGRSALEELEYEEADDDEEEGSERNELEYEEEEEEEVEEEAEEEAEVEVEIEAEAEVEVEIEAEAEEEEEEEDSRIINFDDSHPASFASTSTSQQQKRRRTIGPCQSSRMDFSSAWGPLSEVNENVEEPDWTTDTSSASGDNFRPPPMLLMESNRGMTSSNRLVLRQSYDAYRPEEISAIVSEFSARNPDAPRLWSQPQEGRRRQDFRMRRSMPFGSVWADVPDHGHSLK